MFLLLRQLPFVISRTVILMEKSTTEDDWLSAFVMEMNYCRMQTLKKKKEKKRKHCSLNCPLILCSFWCIVCRLSCRLIQNNVINTAFCWSKITHQWRLSKNQSAGLHATYETCNIIYAKSRVTRSLHSYYHYTKLVIREYNER